MKLIPRYNFGGLFDFSSKGLLNNLFYDLLTHYLSDVGYTQDFLNDNDFEYFLNYLEDYARDNSETEIPIILLDDLFLEDPVDEVIETPQPSTKETGKISSIINTARQLLKKRYVWGSKGPNTFDCSGFIQYVFKQNGIKLPGSTLGLFKQGQEIPSLSQARVGDLICSRGTGPSGRHIKMISRIDNNGQIWVIHAKGRKYGVVEEPLKQKNNIVSIRRILA